MALATPGGDLDLAPLSALAGHAFATLQAASPDSQQSLDTLKGLRTLLDTISTHASVWRGHLVLTQRLEVLCRACFDSLSKLEAIFGKATKAEADVVHSELESRYTELADFVKIAGIDEMARTQERAESPQVQEDLILEAVRKIATEDNMPASDHTSIWKHLRERLKTAGFKPSDIERYKTSIFSKLHEALPQLHHASTETSDGHSRNDSAISVSTLYTVPPITTPVSPMTLRERLEKQPFNRGNYRPPAASTIAEDSDDDARSVGSDASTLLGPIDDRRREEYTFRPGVTPRPSSRNTVHMAEPRSPRISLTDERLAEASSSPREGGNFFPPGLRPMQSTYLNRPPPRNTPRPVSPREMDMRGGAVPRPTSPRERDPRFGALPRPPPFQRDNTGGNSKYDFEILRGQRTTTAPAWRYRRHNDLYSPRNQSMDVTDDALPTAAADGRMDEIQRLLREGRNIESFGAYRTTALFRAAKAGHMPIAHLLLKHGANPNPRRRDGTTLARLLAEDNAVEMLRLLLEYGANIHHQAILPHAASSGLNPLVQLLLDHHADVDEPAPTTPVYRAVAASHTQTLALLLHHAANPHTPSHTNRTPLEKALLTRNVPCTRLLLLYGARPTSNHLHLAAEIPNEHLLTLLLRRGVPPNGTPGSRRTPLHLAVRRGHLPSVRVLLDYGADPNIPTDDGRGAVDVALERNHVHLLEALSLSGGYPLLEERSRRYSSSLQDRGRRANGLRPDGGGMVRSRSAASAGRGSSRVTATAAASLIASSFMMLAGG